MLTKEDVAPRPKICWGKHTKHLVYRGGAFDGIEKIISETTEPSGCCYSTSKKRR
jgi:hypothetical protein